MSRSLVQHLIKPYVDTGHHVSVFLTIYRAIGGSRDALLEAFAPRVVSVNTLQHDSTPSQILPLAAGVHPAPEPL